MSLRVRFGGWGRSDLRAVGDVGEGVWGKGPVGMEEVGFFLGLKGVWFGMER